MSNSGDEMQLNDGRPHVRIIEQPAPKSTRFRYKSENDRNTGSIKGINSKTGAITFPSIQVVGYRGIARVIVSCVTNESPHRPHPHTIVGRKDCRHGICCLEVPENKLDKIQFFNLVIQCTKIQDIKLELQRRESIRIDPFRTGFNHKQQPKSIDLTCVRLCFQVFIQDENTGKVEISLPPVVSNTIYNNKIMSDLIIVELSDCVSYVDGDRKKIILLCEKVSKDDIQIRFFEEKNGIEVWEAFGDFEPFQVHKQTAITFRPPRYHNLEVQNPVRVWVQLKRPSDGATSQPLPFEFLPTGQGKRKRTKLDSLQSLQQHLGLLDNNTSSNAQGGIISLIDVIPPAFSPFKLSDLKDLPSTSSDFAIDNWNIPCIPNIEPESSLQLGHAIDNTHPFNQMQPNLLDLDSNNSELTQINLDSGELERFESILDVTNLSETLNTNLSLTDIRADQNMNDSFTRLANYYAFESLCPEMNHFE